MYFHRICCGRWHWDYGIVLDLGTYYLCGYKHRGCDNSFGDGEETTGIKILGNILTRWKVIGIEGTPFRLILLLQRWRRRLIIMILLLRRWRRRLIIILEGIIFKIRSASSATFSKVPASSSSTKILLLR